MLIKVAYILDRLSLLGFCLGLPSLMVMFLSNSFLKRTVWTPEIAFTTVDFPWATCPMVPMLMVACREMTSGERGVSFEMSCKVEKRWMVSSVYLCLPDFAGSQQPGHGREQHNPTFR